MHKDLHVICGQLILQYVSLAWTLAATAIKRLCCCSTISRQPMCQRSCTRCRTITKSVHLLCKYNSTWLSHRNCCLNNLGVCMIVSVAANAYASVQYQITINVYYTGAVRLVLDHGLRVDVYELRLGGCSSWRFLHQTGDRPSRNA